MDLESCARDLNLAGTATIVVTKNLDVVTTEATGLLELTVIVGDETKLELPRSSPRLTRAGTHCKNQGLTKLKALELMGPSLCGINQCVDGVEDDAMTARTRRKILISTQVRRKMCSGASSTSTCPRKIRAGATLVRSGRSCASARRRRTRIESSRSSPRSSATATSRCRRCPTSSRRRSKIAGGALKHESGLSTKQDSSHHYGYGSRYRDANTSDAVSALLARRGASAAMDIRASLGHVGLNWTPKRHGTVSPALAERIKVALLCAVRDRKRPHKEPLALLPNRILIHNIFSYLADVNSVRINGSLLRDETPPNGVYRAGHLREVSRGYRRGKKKKFVATPLSKLGDSPIGFLGQIYCGEGARVAGDRPQARLDQARDAAAGGTGEPLRRVPRDAAHSYTHTSNDASRQRARR